MVEDYKDIDGKGEDYTIGRLLDYQYYKDHYLITASDLSK